MAIDVEKLLGGAGCDVVTASNSPFTARIGKIYAIIVQEDDTSIESITEDVNGTATPVTSRSWIGGESSDVLITLKANAFLTPDHLCTEIDVAAGSVMVYYTKGDWKHLR